MAAPCLHQRVRCHRSARLSLPRQAVPAHGADAHPQRRQPTTVPRPATRPPARHPGSQATRRRRGTHPSRDRRRGINPQHPERGRPGHARCTRHRRCSCGHRCQTREHTEHALRKFAPLLSPNPRSTKLFLNTYTMLRAVRTLEGITVESDTLALWTILRVRWPAVADYLQHDPDAVKGILEPLWCTELLPTELHAAAKSLELRRIVNTHRADHSPPPRSARVAASPDQSPPSPDRSPSRDLPVGHDLQVDVESSCSVSRCRPRGPRRRCVYRRVGCGGVVRRERAVMAVGVFTASMSLVCTSSRRRSSQTWPSGFSRCRTCGSRPRPAADEFKTVRRTVENCMCG